MVKVSVVLPTMVPLLFFLNGFIEIQFIFYTVHPFKVEFRCFFFKHIHIQSCAMIAAILVYFHHLRKKLQALKLSPLYPSIYLSPWQPIVYLIY